MYVAGHLIARCVCTQAFVSLTCRLLVDSNHIRMGIAQAYPGGGWLGEDSAHRIYVRHVRHIIRQGVIDVRPHLILSHAGVRCLRWLKLLLMLLLLL
jgi:hypothetical protein